MTAGWPTARPWSGPPAVDGPSGYSLSRWHGSGPAHALRWIKDHRSAWAGRCSAIRVNSIQMAHQQHAARPLPAVAPASSRRVRLAVSARLPNPSRATRPDPFAHPIHTGFIVCATVHIHKRARSERNAAWELIRKLETLFTTVCISTMKSKVQAKRIKAQVPFRGRLPHRE